MKRQIIYSVLQSDGNSSAEMSAWAALTWNIRMKNAFEAKNMRSKYLTKTKILNFKSN